MPHCGTQFPTRDQTQGPAAKVPSTNHWTFRQCLVSFEGGPHWPYLQMNHYPTWSILLSLRQTLLNVPSSERSFFFILFLHSASHYLTLRLYGPFIFLLVSLPRVKLECGQGLLFCSQSHSQCSSTQRTIFLYIFVERRKKQLLLST